MRLFRSLSGKRPLCFAPKMVAYERVDQRRLDTLQNVPWVNNPMRFSLRELSGVRISDQASEDTLKAEFRSYFRYKCWISNILLPHNSLDYLTYTCLSMKTTKSWLFLIESQSKDESTLDPSINRDPTNAD